MSLCNGVPGWVAASSPGWPCPPPHPCAGPGPLAPVLGLGRGVILLQGLPACCAGFVCHHGPHDCVTVAGGQSAQVGEGRLLRVHTVRPGAGWWAVTWNQAHSEGDS